MTETKPTSFEDLKPTELYRSAIEDFALPVDAADKNKKKVLIAAFLEGGVKWADYVAQHPEVAPDSDKQEEGNVIMSGDVAPRAEAGVPENIVTSTGPEPQVGQQYLIKMVRDNVRFDAAGQRFTQEHPYALVDEEAADHLLEKEDGFRMATVSELREYYG